MLLEVDETYIVKSQPTSLEIRQARDTVSIYRRRHPEADDGPGIRVLKYRIFFGALIGLILLFFVTMPLLIASFSLTITPSSHPFVFAP